YARSATRLALDLLAFRRLAGRLHLPAGEPPRMGEVEPGAGWQRAIGAFIRELQAGGASPHTLRAYRADLRELGGWATGRGRRPRRQRTASRPDPRDGAARGARPRDARARLRERAAGRGAPHASDRGPRLRVGGGASARKGRQGAGGADRRAGAGGASPVPG